jgi:hypothetical protein
MPQEGQPGNPLLVAQELLFLKTLLKRLSPPQADGLASRKLSLYKTLDLPLALLPQRVPTVKK